MKSQINERHRQGDSPARKWLALASALAIATLGLIAPTAATGSDVAPAVAVAADPTPTCTGNQAWVGFFGDGVACMDSSGIKLINKTNSSIRIGQTKSITTCKTGITWIADSGSLVSTDGITWREYEEELNHKSIEAVACDNTGSGVWVVGYDTVAHFDGTAFTFYPTTKLGTAKYANQVKDVALSSTGVVWITTAQTVARLASGKWSYWQKGRGFSSEVWPDEIIVDAKGGVWMIASSYLYKFSGSKWVKSTASYLYQPQAMVVDARSRFWVGTYSKGLAMWTGSTWKRYTRSNSLIPSDSITALAADTAGKLWVGTDYGLGVLSGSSWKVYRMYNSALADNDIHALSVRGAGPKLPAYQTKANGRLTGRLVKSGSGQAGLKIEACVEYIGMMFFGSTPCSDQVFHKLVSTGSDGHFSFTLPPGKYGLTFRNAAGKWIRLTDGWGIGDKQTLVTPSGVNDIGDINITS